MDELDNYLEKYAVMFDDGFPMYQLGRGRNEEEIIKIIKRCLKLHKDVYELGLVTDEDGVEY